MLNLSRYSSPTIKALPFKETKTPTFPPSFLKGISKGFKSQKDQSNKSWVSSNGVERKNQKWA